MQIQPLGTLQFQQKSKRKAGEGKSSGLYKFFTSSSIQKNFVDEADFIGPALIFGTGGSASIHFCDEYFSTSTDCFILKSDDTNIDLKYIYYFLSGNIEILEQGFKGAGLKHISKEFLSQIQIPLPPIQIQKQIIQKLDKLTHLIELRKQSIQKTEQLTKSIFIEMFGDPMINPKGWEVNKLNCITKISSGGTPNRKKLQEYYNGDIFWAKTTEVKGDYIYNTEEKITKEALEETSCKIYPEETILLAMYGQGKTRGNVGLLKIKSATNQACAGIYPSNNINQLFLYSLLKFSYYHIRSFSRGGNQENLNLNLVGELNIIIPPLLLQNKFALIVQKNEENIKKQKDSLKKLEELYNATMQECFSF